jgi:NitT/TauT family transport system substrate-binding protein
MVCGRWRRSVVQSLMGLSVALGLGLACAPAAAPRPAPSGQTTAPAAPQAAVGSGGAAGGSASAPGNQPAAAPTSAPEFAKLNLHLPSRSTSYLPWYLAIERGYFKEQNLDVEILQAPGAIGVKALVAGEMHFTGAATSAIPAMAQGTPLKVVYVQSGKPNYWFTTRPEIRTLRDLKGKKVVVPNLGGSTYERLLSASLRRQGMDPATDVTYIGGGSAGGGGSDVLVGALVAGLADGMVGNVLQRLAAEEHGFHTIHGFGDEFADIQGGVATSEDMLRNRADVTRRFMTAAVKGTRVMEQDPDTSLDVLLKYVEMDREDAAKGLGYVRPLMAKDGLLTAQEARDGLASVLENSPEIGPLEATQVFEFGPLQEAVRAVDASGWKAK